MSLKKEHLRWLIYIIFFICFFYIAYQVPYCHDEWQWGLDERVDLLKQGFKDYNGRYLGNILALMITRSVLVKAAIISGGVVWLLWEIEQNVSGGKKEHKACDIFLLLGAALLLLVIPRQIFAQSYGWPAAFVNFVPPVIFFLIYFRWTGQIYHSVEVYYSRWQVILAIPMGIAAQLFSEHNTIFLLCYAAWVLVFSWIKSKKVHLFHIVYLVSCVCGAALMFSNGAYGNAAADTDGYKHIGFSVSSFISVFCETISEYIFLKNWLINGLLAVVLTGIIIKSRKKTLLTAEMVLVFCGYAVYSIWHRLDNGWIFVTNSVWNDRIETVLALIFWANVLLCVWIFVKDESRYFICILYASALAVAVPLLAAAPIGARCFYVSYVLECAALLKLCRYVLRENDRDFFYPIMGLGVVLVTVLIIYVRMFGYIGAANGQRAEIIRTSVENGATEITLPVLPFGEYYWITVPPNERWEKRFKMFYDIPLDVELTFE